MFRDVIRLLRIHQWIKNTLVFVGPLAAHALFDADNFSRVLIVFFAFCACASGVYVLNDLVDLRVDRQHPRKRSRPFASGRLSVRYGVLGPVLILLGLTIGFTSSLVTGILMSTYALLSLTYSHYLKTQPLVDVFTLSGLYTLRVFVGEAAIDLDPSVWLLLFSGFMFLSLAFLKRVSEYHAMMADGVHYETRRGYTPGDIDMLKAMGLSASYIATMVLGLYINTETAASEYSHPILLWGVVPIFLFWQSRMWLSSSRGFMTDDPIVYAARDWVSHLCLLALLGVYGLASFY